MTIEPIHVYALTVAQNLCWPIGFLSMGFFVASGGTYLFAIFSASPAVKKDFPDLNPKRVAGLANKLLTCAIVLSLYGTVVPSWKDLALIYGVPTAVNGGEVVLHDIGEQYPKVKALIESKLDEALGDLNND